MFVWGIFGNELSGQKNEAFHADCINRTVKFPKGVTIWGCMSAKDLGNFKFIDRIVNAEKYHKILTNGKNRLFKFKKLLSRKIDNTMAASKTKKEAQQ
jgi:hypothetical protein